MSIDYAEIARLAKKGRRSERRGKFVGKLIESLITAVLTAFLGGWMFMLAVGVAHAHWWQAVPTIGYWWAVLIVGLLPGMFMYPSKRKDD